MEKIKNIIKDNFSYLSIAGIIVGAIGGYLYYYFIGCTSGSCAITSNPYMSILWGAAFGYLIFDMFRAKKKKETNQDDEISS